MSVLYDLISQLRVVWETWTPEDQSRTMNFSSSLSLSPGETAYHVAIVCPCPLGLPVQHTVCGGAFHVHLF